MNSGQAVTLGKRAKLLPVVHALRYRLAVPLHKAQPSIAALMGDLDNPAAPQMDSGTSAHMLAMDRGAREVELKANLPKLIGTDEMPMM